MGVNIWVRETQQKLLLIKECIFTERRYCHDPAAEKCDNMMVLVKQLRIAAHNGEFGGKNCVIVSSNLWSYFKGATNR